MCSSDLQAIDPQQRPAQVAPRAREVRHSPDGLGAGEAARPPSPGRRELPEPVRVVKPDTMALVDEPSVRVEESRLLWFTIITELLLNLVLSLRFSTDYIDNLKGLISNRNVVTRKGANKVAAICTATQELHLTLQLALLTAVVRHIISDRVSLQILLQGISLIIHFKIRMSFSGGFVPFKPGSAGAVRPAAVNQPAGARSPALTPTELNGKPIIDKLEQQATKDLQQMLKAGNLSQVFHFAGAVFEQRQNDRSRGSASITDDGLKHTITFEVATGTRTALALEIFPAIDPNINIHDLARSTTVEEPLPTTTGAVNCTTRVTVRNIVITPPLANFIANGGPSVANVPDTVYFCDIADAFSVRYLIPAEGRPTIAALYLLFAGNVSQIQGVLYQRYLQLMNDHGVAAQARGVRLGDVAFRGDDRRLTKLRGEEILHLDIVCATSRDVNILVQSGMLYTLQFCKPPTKPIVLQLQLPTRDASTDQLNADLWERKKQDAIRTAQQCTPPLAHVAAYTAPLTVEYTSVKARRGATTADMESAFEEAVGGLVSGCLGVHVPMTPDGRPEHNSVTYFLGDKDPDRKMSKAVKSMLLEGIAPPDHHSIRSIVIRNSKKTIYKDLSAVNLSPATMPFAEALQALRCGMGNRGVTYVIPQTTAAGGALPFSTDITTPEMQLTDLDPLTGTTLAVRDIRELFPSRLPQPSLNVVCEALRTLSDSDVIQIYGTNLNQQLVYAIAPTVADQYVGQVATGASGAGGGAGGAEGAGAGGGPRSGGGTGGASGTGRSSSGRPGGQRNSGAGASAGSAGPSAGAGAALATGGGTGSIASGSGPSSVTSGSLTGGCVD